MKSTVASHRIVCNSCKAAFTSQSTSPIKFCPYCGSNSFRETIVMKDGETGVPTEKKDDFKNDLALIAKFVFITLGVLFALVVAISFFNDFSKKSKSDYLQNEVAFGRTNNDPKVTFLSDTIQPGVESMELNQNPFTYETGLKVVDAKTELNLAVPSTNKLGATIRANINFKNIGTQNFKKGIKATWKVKDMKTNSIIIDGSQYITFDTNIAPGESWTKPVDLFECTFLFSKKVTIEMKFDDIPMESIMYK